MSNLKFSVYPKISIITPSLNQGLFLESCIKSVISQQYPNLEYIVLDGGSTDLSKIILKKYSDYITFWRSEKDKGQYFAIQEGIERSTGEIIMWLNSDDMLHPGALWRMAEEYMKDPEALWYTGIPTAFNIHDEIIYINLNPPDWSYEYFLNILNREPYIFLQQESTFFTRKLWEIAGGYIDTNYKLAADFELWLRFSKFKKVKKIDRLIGGFRIHGEQKSLKQYQEYLEEVRDIISKYKKKKFIFKDFSSIHPFICKCREKHQIATSIAPKDYIKQYNAICSWIKNGFLVHSFNCDEEIEKLKPLFPNVIFHRVDTTANDKFGKPYVQVSDIFEYFYEERLPFTLVNSDIFMSTQRGLGDAISFHLRDEKPQIIVASRVEIENEFLQLRNNATNTYNSNLNYGWVFVYGFDLFSFNLSAVDILYNEITKTKNYIFYIGLPWWDYYLTMLAFIKGITVKYLYPSPIYHFRHETNYPKKIWQELGLAFCLHFDILDENDAARLKNSDEDLENYLFKICSQFQRFFFNNISVVDLGSLVRIPQERNQMGTLFYATTYENEKYQYQNENVYLRELIAHQKKILLNIEKFAYTEGDSNGFKK
ncbi:MAG: glycosyltransferase family 2 protein [Candidatus Aenigmatarchaeota archaeon]